ncbi:putative coiled-coil domain-containing protein 144C [Erinaceus europaeus]|uniref:Coiled-coil domain-containing protein 144C n=1 Tax=Erinaceus europaeus TaxID=9365 RepID=A0ABM3WM29_ERIEU|nr:putative coiled-coil domain-containing protein 144C [Erinaceus europaeus]
MTKKKNADEDQAGKKGGSGMAFLQRVNSVFSKNQPKSQRKHPNAQSVGMSTPEKEAMSSTQRGEPGRTTDEWNAHHVPKPCVSEESSKVVEDPETHGRMELQKTKYDAPAVDYRLIHPTKNGGTANQTFIPFETGDSALFLRNSSKKKHMDPGTSATTRDIFHMISKLQDENATLKHEMDTVKYQYEMLKHHNDILERKYHQEVTTKIRDIEHLVTTVKEVTEEEKRNDTGSPATLSNILDIIQKLKDEIVTLKQDMEKMRQENLMPKEDKDRQERKDSQQDTGNPTTVRNILHTIQNLKDEIATLNQHMERLQHKFLVQKQDIDRLERKENEGRTTVRYTKHETIKVKEVREEVLRNDTDSPSSQNNILHTIQKLKDEIASLKQDMEILQQENLMLKQDMNRQERKDSQQDTGSPATLSNILHTSQKLKDEIATLKRDMKTMQHDYVMLKQDMDRQERKDNQKDTVSPATLRNILDTNQKLQDENATLKRDIDTMQNEYVMLKEDIDRLGKKAYQHDSDSHEKSRERFHEIQELQDEIATIKQLLDIVKHHYKMRMQMLKQNKDRLKTSHHEMKSEDIK